MAIWRDKVGPIVVEIYDCDHGPAHCHISGLSNGTQAKVNLLTLMVVKPKGLGLPRAIDRYLKANQVDMLVAWESVRDINGGE